MEEVGDEMTEVAGGSGGSDWRKRREKGKMRWEEAELLGLG